MATIDPYQPGVVMELTRFEAMGEPDNLDKLHNNPIWQLAWKLSRPKAEGGLGLPAMAAAAKAEQEAERLAPESKGWAQALVDWRAWRFE